MPAPERTVLSFSTGEVALGSQTPPFDAMAALYYPAVEAARAARTAASASAAFLICDEHLMSQKPNPELYFRSVEDIRAMFAGPIPVMMRKDEENFVQMDAPAVRLVAEEIAV